MSAILQMRSNKLFSAMSIEACLQLLPHIEWVDLPLGKEIYATGKNLNYVYFPTTAVISLFYMMSDGASAEIAVVGKEGVIGLSLFLSGLTPSCKAVTHSAGRAFRMSGDFIKEAFSHSKELSKVILRYVQAQMTQISITSVCNRHHMIDQRLCRWLLLSLDRLSGNDIHMTQCFIANMLGVRREGITEAALNLQKLGLIQYTRGHITILDRQGLEKRSCECYSIIKSEYQSLLNPSSIDEPPR